MKVRWSYGVTTVPERFTLLKRTIESLDKSGFTTPRLFVDGDTDQDRYQVYGLPVTFRDPQIGAWGNWCLALWELYIREPNQHRYCIFQDDIVAYTGLKDYLDGFPIPKNCYWNLYTFATDPALTNLTPEHDGWFRSNQRGRGAVALVFTRDALINLVSAKLFAWKPCNVKNSDRNIDGLVIKCLQPAGYSEMVHNPSLVEHTSQTSSLGNPPRKPTSFRGEDYALSELKNATGG